MDGGGESRMELTEGFFERGGVGAVQSELGKMEGVHGCVAALNRRMVLLASA